MATAKEIVEALRCSSSTDAACKKRGCPYYSQASRDQQKEFFEHSKVNPKKIPDDFWDECDVDRISMDAAELIEELTGMKEPSTVTIIS